MYVFIFLVFNYFLRLGETQRDLEKYFLDFVKYLYTIYLKITNYQCNKLCQSFRLWQSLAP